MLTEMGEVVIKICIVEDEKEHYEVIKNYIGRCSAGKEVDITWVTDGIDLVDDYKGQFDIIFLDPPYAEDVLEQALAHIAGFDILAPHGIIIAESPAEKTLPALAAPYGVYREYRYGKIKVTIYHREGEEMP